MRIWTIANQKGGVGKTTTAAAFAGLLADQGQRVLLLDLDPHGSLTSYFGYDPDTIKGSVYDLFSCGGSISPDLPAQLVLSTSHPRVQMIAASTMQATLERRMAGVDGMGRVIDKSLQQLQHDFDFVLIDNTPVLGVLMINSLAASEFIVIPVQTEHLALQGLERMLHTLRMVMRSQQKTLPHFILPTMFDRRTQASLQAFRSLRRDYQHHCWRYAIPVDTKFRDASRVGKFPSQYDVATHGVRAYRRLLTDLLQDPVGSKPAGPGALAHA